MAQMKGRKRRQAATDPRTDSPAGTSFNVQVRLSRGDFLYYNWTLALERPVLPFFLYSFGFFFLTSLLGLWPQGRLYAFAVLVPMLGYALFVWLSSLALWRRFPQLRNPRSYAFGPEHYLVETEAATLSIPYTDLARVLESRAAFYLVRRDGSADVLPKRALADEASLRRLLERQLGEVRRSSFL